MKANFPRFLKVIHFTAILSLLVAGSAVFADPIYYTYYSPSGKIATKEDGNENASGEFFGRHVKYYYYDEDSGVGYGRIYRIDVYDDPMQYDSYLDFDGADDNVNCGNDASLDLIGDFTIEAWINTSNTAACQAIVSRYDSDYNGYLMMIGELNNSGKLAFWTSSGTLASGNTVIADGAWHHVAIAISGSMLTFYVDGVFDGSTIDYFTPDSSTSNFLIGMPGTSDVAGFDGRIDNVCVYGRALSGTEINDRFNGTDITSGLISRWLLDEGSGSVADDSYGVNDGAISGAQWVIETQPSTDGWYYDIVYANPGNPTDDTILSKTRKDIATGQIIESRTYYNDANNFLESVTYASADPYGNLYYHYKNEDFGGQGYGRVDGQYLAAADQEGAIYYFYEYYTGTAVLSKKDCYAAASYADPSNPTYSTLVSKYEYDALGVQQTKTTYFNDADNRMRSQTFASADVHGNVYYLFMNEDWQSQGYGKVEKQVLAAADADGATGYVYEYYGDGTVSKKTCYAGTDYTNSNNPNFWNMVSEYQYDATGRLTRDDHILEDRYNTYSYFGAPDENQPQYKYIYERSTNTLICTIEYDTSGNIIGITYGTGVEIIEKYPVTENWKRKIAANGCVYEYMDEYKWGDAFNHYGRYTLIYEYNGYKAWTWDDTVGAEQVTVTEYDGDYIPVPYGLNFDPLTSTAGRTTVIVYDRDPALDGNGANLDTATNGWIERIKTVYDVDGVTILEKYFRDAQGSLQKIIKTADNTCEIFEYYGMVGVVDSKKLEYIYDEAQEGDVLAGTATGTLNSISTFKYDPVSQTSYINSYIRLSDGVIHIYNWDANWDIVNVRKEYPDGTVEICTPLDPDDPVWPLAEKREPASSMLKKGVNMPWINYGYDIGSQWGFSSNLSQLYDKMNSRAGDYVRVFLFNDFRAGMTFDGNGVPTGFTASVYADMQALLDAARALGVKLMPTLFDYTLGVYKDGNGDWQIGPHPDLISDPAKRAALLGIMDDFIAYFKDDPAIYAWDIINEPEWNINGGIAMSDIYDFIKEFADMIHTQDPGSTVTLGNCNRQDMLDMAQYFASHGWANVIDLYQFHYYDYMENDMNPVNHLDYSFTSGQLALLAGKPIFVGEIEPTDITAKLDVLRQLGYAGALFWEDGNFYVIDDTMYQEIQDWFYGTIYTYYTDTNFLESATYAEPQNGDVYYRYMNELFYDNGTPSDPSDDYGRVDGQIRASVDGEGAIGYTYVYYAGSSVAQFKYLYTTADYSDPSNPIFSGLIITYEYYTDGLVHFKTLANGTIYEYEDFPFFDNGTPSDPSDDYGRLIKETAPDDSYAIYEYYLNSQNCHFKHMYTAAGVWYITYIYAAPPAAPWTYIGSYSPNVSYTYYVDTGYLESVTYTTPMGGDVYYHYINENIYGDYGRIDKQVRVSADSDGAIAYEYVYVGSSAVVRTKKCYTAADYSDPTNPVLSGLFLTYTYYADTARLESKTRGTADAFGNVYYHYLNEPFFNNGTPSYPNDDYGRIDSQVCALADSNGAIGYIYEYYADSAVAHFKRCYRVADYSDPSNPQFSDLIVTYEYDTNGNLIGTVYADATYTYYLDTGYLESVTYATPHNGDVYYHYLNEIFYDNGTPLDPTDDYGRVDKQVRASADPDGAIAYAYTYYTGTDTVHTKACYGTADYSDPTVPVFTNLLVTYTYYADTHLMESKTLLTADTFGNLYYHYLNEPFFNNGTPTNPNDDYGRIDSQVCGLADTDGAIGYIYEYYTDSAVAHFKRCYRVADCSDPSNPQFSDLIVTYEYDTNGNLIGTVYADATYTYYLDTGYLESVTYATPHNGDIYYHYINEAFYDNGTPGDLTDDYGRLDKQVRALADDDGAIAYAYTYYAGTDLIETKVCYSTADYSNPSNPVLSVPIVTYAYYDNAQNRMLRKELVTPEANGNYAYEYLDEDAGDGYGRISRIEVRGPQKTYLNFDGVNDYANCGKGSSLNITGDLTMAIWVKTTTTASRVIIDKYSPTVGYGLRLGTGATVGKIGFRSDSAGTWIYCSAPVVVNDGAWHHVAVSCSGSLGTFYIDGIACGTFTYVHPLDSSAENLYIGAGANGTANFFPGGLSDMNLFSRGLTEEEIGMLMIGIDITNGLAASWDMDEGSGTVLGDDSGNGNSGTIMNGAAWQTTSGRDYYYELTYYDPAAPTDNTVYMKVMKDAFTDIMIESYTYYNDAANLMQSKTLPTGDIYGNVYYHYLNEAFYDNGTPLDTTDDYGRVESQVRALADAAGAIGYVYEYYTGSSVAHFKHCYRVADYSDPSNPQFSDLIVTYEYDTNGNLIGSVYADVAYTYYPDTGYLESVTYAAPQNGDVYYHYLNEIFYDNGTPLDPTDDYGRVDKQVRASADPDGAIAYEYAYYTGTDIVHTKACYADADYSDPSNPVLSNLIVTYTYDSSGNMIRKEYPNGAYYEYDALGRLIREYIPGVSDTTWTYFGPTAAIDTKVVTALDGSGIIVTYTFYDDPANLMESKTISEADGFGNLYYHYLNESFFDNGTPANPSDDYGRVDVQVLASLDPNGAICYVYDYYAGSQQARFKYCYGTADYSDPSNPTYSNLIVTYEYDEQGRLIGQIRADGIIYTYYAESGRLKTKEILSETVLGQFFGKHMKYYYQDEASYYDVPSGTWYGRMSRIDNITDNLGWYYYYKESNPLNYDVNLMYYVDNADYLAGETYRYRPSPGGTGPSDQLLMWKNFYYDSLLEGSSADSNWHSYAYDIYDNNPSDGVNVGRLVWDYDCNDNASSQADDTVTQYAYYSTTVDWLWKKWTWSAVDYYNVLSVYTYYNNASNLMQSKTLPSGDVYGNVYYHYLDENFYDNGTPLDTSDDYGRVDSQVCALADTDGAIGYIYEYYTDLGVAHFKRCYRVADYSDPSNPQFSDLIVTYEYDTNGNLIGTVYADATYTYYLDTGLLESVTYATPHNGDVYYHYTNEAFYDNGTPGNPTDDYGRVDKQVRASADDDGAIAYAYTYYAGTDLIETKVCYSTADHSNPSNPVLSGQIVTYTYYDNAQNRMLRKELVTPEANGNYAYEYLDEDAGDGYGRISRIYVGGSQENHLTFDGTNDYVNCGNGASLDITGGITIDLWIKTTATTGNMLIDKYGASSPYYGFGLYLGKDANAGKIGFWSNAIGAWKYSTVAVNDGAWHHVAVSCSGSLGTFYIDGVACGTFTYAPPTNHSAQNLYIASQNGGTGFFNGSLSGIDIFNRGLTEEEISMLMSGINITSGLAASWDMDEGSGTVLGDDSGNGNNGTIMNGAAWGTHTGRDYYYELTYYNPADPADDTVYMNVKKDAATDITIESCTCYNDAANLMQSKTPNGVDDSGNVYYHYLNEDFGGEGYGRVDVQVLDSTDVNGAICYVYDYYAGSSVAHFKYCYGTADYSDPSNPTYSDLIITYEYDESGNLITDVTYTYYNDANHYLESATRQTPDAYGNVYYHYLNEDWNALGYGRVDKQVRGSVDSDNAIAYVYAYYAGYTDVIKINTKECYGSADYSDPTNPVFTNLKVTYSYFEGSQRMFEKIIAGGASYKYYDEAFYNNGTPSDPADDYGRIYKMDTTDGKTFTYVSYYAGTDLKAQVTEASAYPGTLYYYYDAYTQGGNEIGFTKHDTNGSLWLDFQKTGPSSYRLEHKKEDLTGNEYWYLWDEAALPGMPVGWKPLYEYDAAAANWYVYAFNPASADPMNPNVQWTRYQSGTPLSQDLQDAYSNPDPASWPPSAVDTPIAPEGLKSSEMSEPNLVLDEVTAIYDVQRNNLAEFNGYDIKMSEEKKTSVIQ